MSKRKRKKRIDKTDVFEYGALLLQFSPQVPLETSHHLWADVLSDHYPETTRRYCLHKCCKNPDCRKIFIMFKVDPQPKGSGFCLQMSESKTSLEKGKTVPKNTIADLIFEHSFGENSIQKYYTSCQELRQAKILSLSECVELCERFARHCYYTRIIFEHEQWLSMYLVMEGDPIYGKWVTDLTAERKKFTDAEAEANAASMIDMMRTLKGRYTPNF